MLSSSLLVLALLAAESASPPPESPPPRPSGDEIHILATGDPEYEALTLPETARAYPDALTRLVVFRRGVPVFDRGLRTEKRLSGASEATGEPGVEDGLTEDAIVSLDGKFAVVLSTHYRKLVDEPDRTPRVKSELSWVDPAHATGLWSVSLEEGRWVKKVLPLSQKHGIAVVTLASPDGPGDLRLFGPEGTEMLRIPEDEASVADVMTTSYGAFLAVDLAFPDTGEPHADRGIAVLDLLHGTRWTYTWSYGAAGEPLQWTLEDSGALELRTPDGIRRFDRNGKALKVDKKHRA